MAPRISLEQWRCLVAVVEAGGFAQAAERLHKSQSAVSHAVARLQELLAVQAFELQGRKAVLTAAGQLLYRRAQALLDEAQRLETAARTLSAGWEPEIAIAAEILVPNSLLLAALDRFGSEAPLTRIELIESVLGGTSEALLQQRVDLAITPRAPPGFLGEHLLRLRIVAVAHPDHALHRLGRELTLRDLRQQRNVVVRDSGSQRDRKAVNVEAEQRWVVSQMSTSIRAVSMGYGFSWFPEDKIRDQLARGLLKPLPLGERSERYVDLYLVLADPQSAGPGVRRLAQLLRETAGTLCAAARAGQAVEPD